MKDERLPYNPKTMTVMIVDDQDPIRKAIRRIVISMGFDNILEYSDGADAIKILGKKPIDLILTDIYMRKVDGFSLLKKIRSQNFGSDVPIIVITGEASKEDIIKAADLGADDYLLKPFQVSDVEKKITTVLLKYFSPSPLLQLMREADKLFLEDRFEDALKRYEAASRLDPKSPRAKLGKALVMEKLDQKEEALNILRLSLVDHPTYYKNFAAIADIFMGLDNKQETIKAMRNELELNPKQADRQILLANILQREGDYIGAINHYRLALIENPKSAEALLGSGICYESAGNNEKAIYYFKRARRYHPNLTKALRLIVELYERDDNPRAAIFELLDEIKVNPNRVDARILLAETYFKYENLEGAFKTLDEGLAKAADNVPLIKAKAKLLANTNDIENACAAYKRVVELEPTSKHHLLLGEALLAKGETTSAFKSFFAAVEIGGEDRQRALIRVGESLKRLGYSLQAVMSLYAASKVEGSIKQNIIDQEIKSLMTTVLKRRGGNQIKQTG